MQHIEWWNFQTIVERQFTTGFYCASNHIKIDIIYKNRNEKNKTGESNANRYDTHTKIEKLKKTNFTLNCLSSFCRQSRFAFFECQQEMHNFRIRKNSRGISFLNFFFDFHGFFHEIFRPEEWNIPVQKNTNCFPLMCGAQTLSFFILICYGNFLDFCSYTSGKNWI